MCGIAGYIGSRMLDDSIIDSCLNLMKRRGPDYAASKFWQPAPGRNVFFLHSRLSIIDVDPRSNQPFQVGQKWIVYNAELYNYLELVSDLKKQGHSFRTTSDTEVFLRAIDHYGWSVLDRFEGMWAVAVYDESDGSVTLSRDRFGEKPLWLYRDSSGLYFGSEIKFLQALAPSAFSINEEQLHRYLVNGYKSLYKGRETFFKGVEELPRSSTLRITAAGEERNEYWQPRYCADESMSYEAAVAGVRERLTNSVKLRLRADVPLAFCMSGGVDSNAIISIAKNVFAYDVHGFTIVNSDARYEEQDMVNAALDYLKIRHTSIPVSVNEFIPKMKTLVRQHDAPVYTITYFAHWMLMQSIADNGYRISISGTAADELFTGYYDHHLAYLNEVSANPQLYKRSRQAWTEHIRPIVRNPFLSDPDLFIKNPSMRDHIYLNADEFASWLRFDWHEPFQEKAYCGSLLRNRMLNEMFHEAVPVILHEDDLNAMYYSIENRSPFLDRELFEFCFRIPSRHLIQDGRAKAVLRDAMHGIAPESVMQNRRKVGFNAPILDFLDLTDTAVSEYLLDQGPIFDHVRRDRIEKLVSKGDLPNSESKFLFYFVSAKMFLEEFSN